MTETLPRHPQIPPVASKAVLTKADQRPWSLVVRTPSPAPALAQSQVRF
jgi:hypothetical protein